MSIQHANNKNKLVDFAVVSGWIALAGRWCPASLACFSTELQVYLNGQWRELFELQVMMHHRLIAPLLRQICTESELPCYSIFCMVSNFIVYISFPYLSLDFKALLVVLATINSTGPSHVSMITKELVKTIEDAICHTTCLTKSPNHHLNTPTLGLLLRMSSEPLRKSTHFLFQYTSPLAMLPSVLFYKEGLYIFMWHCSKHWRGSPFTSLPHHPLVRV
jgi:hypothetical protein